MAEWTQEEVSTLKQLYARMPKTELSKLLPKHSYGALLVKAKELGIAQKREIKVWGELHIAPVELGFVAGVLEGEETVTLLSRGKGKCLSPVVEFYNTKPELLLAVQKYLNNFGSVSQTTHSLSKKPLFIYRIFNWRQIKAVLTVLEPHLIIKQRQVQIVLNFIDGNYRKVRKGQDKNYAEYIELRALNGHNIS